MHHSQPGWIQQVKSDVLLVQRLLDAVKRGSLFGEQNADTLIDPNSGTLVPELMVPGPAQSGFFLLESGEADQERAGGGGSLAGFGNRGSVSSLQVRRNRENFPSCPSGRLR